MKQKTILTTALLGAIIGGALLGLTLGRSLPTAQAAPMPLPTKTSGGTADLFNGKTFPLTLMTDDIDTTYHLVAFVDAQGKPGTYVTKGETVTLGGETFVAAYAAPLLDAKGNFQPKSGETAVLTLINLRSVEAVVGIRPILPAASETPKDSRP